jgi:hypothetical protein
MFIKKILETKPNKQNDQVEIGYFAQKKIVFYKIPPHLTDASIDNWLEPHYVAFNQNIKHRPQLFLCLNGSFGKPGQQKLFLREVVNLGYLAINLNYPNDWTIANLCQNSKNLDCHRNKRKAIIYGQDNARKITITTANSLENRLSKLLLFLAKNVSQIPWLNYLNSHQIKWESVIIAGHSQGGGHAALIAKENLVSRVIMLASPADYNQYNHQMASWLSAPQATPSDRFYGFVHAKDPAYAKIIKAWDLLGLSNHGDLINVDRVQISNLNSHQLVTVKSPKNLGRFHGSVFNDHHTPISIDGQPIYKNVWQYLCIHNTI